MKLIGFSGFGLEPIVAPCLEDTHCPDGYTCQGTNCEPALAPSEPPKAGLKVDYASAGMGVVAGLIIGYLAFGRK